MSAFYTKLQNQWNADKFVCVGLDPVPAKIPNYQGIGSILGFNADIIDATGDLVAAFKPNVAFYECHGSKGVGVLYDTFAYIEENFPLVVKICDAKLADIGKTNDFYANFVFDYLGADAVTVHPYLGGKSLDSFLKRADKGVIVLCKTSNEDSGELQDRLTLVLWDEFNELTKGISYEEVISRGFYEGVNCWRDLVDLGVLMPLSHLIALRVSRKWNYNGNCALVVGATYPEDIAKIRFLASGLPLLFPGVGTQGGDVEKTVKAGVDKNGAGFVVNSSSGIIHASSEANFAEIARQKTIELSNSINQFR